MIRLIKYKDHYFHLLLLIVNLYCYYVQFMYVRWRGLGDCEWGVRSHGNAGEEAELGEGSDDPPRRVGVLISECTECSARTQRISCRRCAIIALLFYLMRCDNFICIRNWAELAWQDPCMGQSDDDFLTAAVT
jgi:hypothetical protein